MREIKFRIFDTRMKRLLYIKGFIKSGTEIRIWYFLDGAIVNESFDLSNVILEQYTGRKDKNGVGLYQGDQFTYANQTPIHTIGDLVTFGDQLKRLGDYNGISFPYTQGINLIGNIHDKETK